MEPLDASWSHLGAPWTYLGATLELPGAILTLLGLIWESLWIHVGAILPFFVFGSHWNAIWIQFSTFLNPSRSIFDFLSFIYFSLGLLQGTFLGSISLTL